MFWRRKEKTKERLRSTRSYSVDPNERIYAIGDIHGRADLLDPLLMKIVEDAVSLDDSRQVRLIFLGDYIDRGDHASDVISRLMQLQSELGEKAQFLAGNHEAALLGFLDDPVKGSSWLRWGGRQTLASYNAPLVSPRSSRKELHAARDALAASMGPHVDFLRGLDSYTVSGSVAFAHAALDPDLPLDAQPDAALLWGQVAKQAEGHPDFRLVHGHFANPEPVSLPQRVCADTGAYYSGILTAVRLDESEHFVKVTLDDLGSPQGFQRH